MKLTHIETGEIYTGDVVVETSMALIYDKEGNLHLRPLGTALSKFITGLGVAAIDLYECAAKELEGEIVNKVIPLADNEVLTITAYAEEGVLYQVVATKSHVGANGEVTQVGVVTLYDNEPQGSQSTMDTNLYNLAVAYL